MMTSLRYIKLIWVLWIIMGIFPTVLGGCGSSRVARQGPVADADLERLNRAARLAYSKGRIQQAAALFKSALERAYLRDDVEAIVDAQYNLAVCRLKLQAYDEALDLVRQAEEELSLAGRKQTADLLLLKAVLFYKTGHQVDAWSITARIFAMAPQPSAAVRGRTHFLRGLIAIERGAVNQLRNEIAALGEPKIPSLRADRFELQGHLAMAEHNWTAAIKAFDQCVKLRRETIEYQGMVKGLALAGNACEKAGQLKQAAVRYLRAGRSAVLQEDFEGAQIWLGQAVQLAGKAGDDKIVQEAGTYLKQIEEAQTATE